jgi:hypothetical protein
MQKTLSVLSAASFVVTLAACQSSTPLTPTTPLASTVIPADGSTLKATAPTPQSPVNDVRLETFALPTLTAGGSNPTHADGLTLQYRFQLLSETGAVLEDSGLRSSTNWVPSTNLEFDKRYSWQVRAESEGDPGPWSARASFLSPNGGFIRGNELFDPLTNGRTVGSQVGGTIIPGRGWRADTDFDGIDYDVSTCSNCTLEFDVTNFGKAEGGNRAKDVKWVSMGSGPEFGDFVAFRNHNWKMHLEQRGDGDGTGMKLIWRNGDAGDGEPGDHTGKVDPSGINWNNGTVYHFTLYWTPSGFEIWIGETQPDGSIKNNREYFRDGFGGHAYAPPQHRISLGTRSRGETMSGAIWRNVKLYPGSPRTR